MSKTIEARQSTWLSKAAAALTLIVSVVLVLTPEWARAEPPASIPMAQAKVSADPATDFAPSANLRWGRLSKMYELDSDDEKNSKKSSTGANNFFGNCFIRHGVNNVSWRIHYSC